MNLSHLIFCRLLLGGIIILTAAGCEKERDKNREKTEWLLTLLDQTTCEIQDPSSGLALAHPQLIMVTNEPQAVPFDARYEFGYVQDYHGSAKLSGSFDSLQLQTAGTDRLSDLIIFEVDSCPVTPGITPRLIKGTDYSESLNDTGTRITFHGDYGGLIIYMMAPGSINDLSGVTLHIN